MKRRSIGIAAMVAITTIWTSTARAQLVVFDPTNYVQAIAQVQQLIRQYQFWSEQIRRVPVDIASRYRAQSLPWNTHPVTTGALYAQQILRALNSGDVAGSAYRALVDPLDLPTDIIARLPPALSRRLTGRYGAIELQDSITRLAIDQTGSARTAGPTTLQAVLNVASDIANVADAFHTQTSLLEKINAASAIGLRLEQQTNQFQLTTLEQLIVENTRRRDTEAGLMNATIYQWRYGQSYGQDLFRNTRTNIDTWRPF